MGKRTNIRRSATGMTDTDLVIQKIFNPWSVINYITDQCFPKAFWQSTGSNEIIGEIIATATPEITEGLHKLLCGEKNHYVYRYQRDLSGDPE